MKTVREKIEDLLNHGGYGNRSLEGLINDARYCGLCRLYGQNSAKVLYHLIGCSKKQQSERNHT